MPAQRPLLVAIATLTLLALAPQAHAAYCSASGGGDEYIAGVYCGDIATMSSYSSGGYGNFTAFSTTVEPGQSYPIRVDNGRAYNGDRAAAWCDWNQDNDFTDPGETITLTADLTYGTWQFNGNLIVPADATPGPTRLRIRICYYSWNLNPCGPADYGEVEDYTVEVSPGGSEDTFTLFPTDDASVCLNAPTTNYGSTNSISAGIIGPTNTYRGYLKFDLSTLPPASRVTSATLRLRRSYASIPAPVINAHFGRIDSWSQDSITFDNALGYLPASASATADSTYLSLDLTADAEKALADIFPDHGFWTIVLTHDEAAGGGGGGGASFWSSENTFMGDDRPRLTLTVEPLFSGGTGSFRDPYRIETVEDLVNIGYYPNRWAQSFLLCNDLDLASVTPAQWAPIGTSGTGGTAFTGSFDGGYHTLANTSFTLFGTVGTNGRIANLHLLDPAINAPAADNVAALASVADYQSAIRNCSVTGGAVKGYNYVAGLVAYCKQAVISRCFADTTVSGYENVGGLVAHCYNGHIDNSYALGAVTGNNRVGGLAGRGYGTALFKNCFAAAAVSGYTETGGFIGEFENPWGPDPDSPLYFEQFVACFWDTTASGQPASAAGQPLDTPASQTRQTFLDAGWDLTHEANNGPSDHWFIGEPNYPALVWQLDPQLPLPPFAGGDGSRATPFLIATADQLNSIGHHNRLMNKHFQLTADVDLAGRNAFPIGDFADPFTGTFNGRHHSIANLKLTQQGLEYTHALFPRLREPNTVVSNLTLLDPTVEAPLSMAAGSLVGWVSHGATVTNCHAVNCNVRGYGAGGLIGTANWFGHVADSSATGRVAADTPDAIASAGGLIGEAVILSNIERCAADVDVSGNYATGGLIGFLGATSWLNDSFALGSATGLDPDDSHVGGLIGRNQVARLQNCYTAAEVSGVGLRGAFAGSGASTSNRYAACFFDNSLDPALPAIGDSTSPELLGRSTSQLYDPNTYLTAGWDFAEETANGTADLWSICAFNSYPRLTNLIPPADLTCPAGIDLHDFTLLTQAWQTTPASPNWNPACDLNHDNQIDLQDLNNLTTRWLQLIGP